MNLEGIDGVGQDGGNGNGGLGCLNGLRSGLSVAVGVQEDPAALRGISGEGPGGGDLVEILRLDGAL